MESIEMEKNDKSSSSRSSSSSEEFLAFLYKLEPEKEQEYYASQGIRSTGSYYRTSPSPPSSSSGGGESVSLFTRSWVPVVSADTRALIFMVHGYGNDISWTFQGTPIFLAKKGYACFALDLPGHGRSDGLRAFVPDIQAVVRDCCISYFNSIRKQYEDDDYEGKKKLKSFLFGESMGGAICLLISKSKSSSNNRNSNGSGSWDGAVLVAPMCKISDNIKPRWPIPQVLTLVARFLPTLPIVPTADLIEKSVKVEEKRAVAARNPMRYQGKPRLGTVVELLRVTDELSRRLDEVDVPFLVLHGSADAVTDPQVSRELYGNAKSEDKTIRIYPGMMHSLLFGETDHNVDLVRNDILEWLNHRSKP